MRIHTTSEKFRDLEESSKNWSLRFLFRNEVTGSLRASGFKTIPGKRNARLTKSYMNDDVMPLWIWFGRMHLISCFQSTAGKIPLPSMENLDKNMIFWGLKIRQWLVEKGWHHFTTMTPSLPAWGCSRVQEYFGVCNLVLQVISTNCPNTLLLNSTLILRHPVYISLERSGWLLHMWGWSLNWDAIHALVPMLLALDKTSCGPSQSLTEWSSSLFCVEKLFEELFLQSANNSFVKWFWLMKTVVI